MAGQATIELGPGVGAEAHAPGLVLQRPHRQIQPVLRHRAHARRQRTQLALEQGQAILLLRVQGYRGAVGAQRALLHLNVERGR